MDHRPDLHQQSADHHARLANYPRRPRSGLPGGGNPAEFRRLPGPTKRRSYHPDLCLVSQRSKLHRAACSEYGHAITLDAQGNVYVAGTTSSATFPTTPGSYEPTYAGDGYSEFIAKLSPDGIHPAVEHLSGRKRRTSRFEDSHRARQRRQRVGFGNHPGRLEFSPRQCLSEHRKRRLRRPYYGIQERRQRGAVLHLSGRLGRRRGRQPWRSINRATCTSPDIPRSRNFPVTANAFQPIFANGDQVYDGNDVFLAILGAGRHRRGHPRLRRQYAAIPLSQ